MTARVGTFTSGELWLRCWFCGDSTKNPNKAHLSVNGEGLYHCMRCGVGGRLSKGEFIALISHYGKDWGVVEITEKQKRNWREVYKDLIPGPASTRVTKLRRHHLLTSRGFYDVFFSRRRTGKVIGLVVVNIATHYKKMMGKRGFGFVGEEIPSKIRLVEGPYDVQYPKDVCTFGIPSSIQLAKLKGKTAILCPDGDIWEDIALLSQLKRTMRRARFLLLAGVEKLPSDKDPDEVPKEEREKLTAEEFYQWRV